MELLTPSTGLIIWQTISLFAIILQIVCLISLLKNNFRDGDKLIWTIVVIFVPIAGSILYLFIGRRKRLLNY
ncbi:PLD nuclease N-terminal domain-containing protein [Rufibacter latericius]